jgi:hypothetical protein
MQVGDLIKEREWPDLGVIIEIKDLRLDRPYGVLCPDGGIEWFTQTYIKLCEVVSESG